jgi:hypothetical protein
MRFLRFLFVTLAVVSAACAARAADSGNVDPVFSKPLAPSPALSSVEQARAAFPEAKRRFLEGFPEGYELRVTAGFTDSAGRAVGNLIIVDTIENGRITGHWCECIARQPSDTKDVYTFSEDDVIDWVIQRPNGVIEGNFGDWPLVSLFVLEQSGTGKTCELAQRAVVSASLSEARKSCDELGARLCRTQMAWLPTLCEGDEAGQGYEVRGVRSYGCCM